MLKTLIHTAWINLSTRLLSSALAVLGILVGTALVVALIISGQLATQKAIAQFNTLGPHLLAFNLFANPSKLGQGASPKTITAEQIQHVLQPIHTIKHIAPLVFLFGNIQFKGHRINKPILGATQALQDTMRVDVSEGRFISFLDRQSYFCVIGMTLAKQLRQYTHKPLVGQQIDISNHIFTIVGIAKPWPRNNFIYVDINNAIIMPLKVSLLLNPYSKIRNVVLRLSKDSDIQTVEKRITQAIRTLVPKQRLSFRSAEQIIKSIKNQSNIFTRLLLIIGAIALLVGGIGVMNIMLVSIKERHQEIGIRIAVGARRLDILLLFLVEAVLIAITGGTLGIGVGLLSAYIIAQFQQWTFTIYWLPVLIGFLGSTGTGLFFGLYPAYRAAQLNPIEILRSE